MTIAGRRLLLYQRDGGSFDPAAASRALCSLPRLLAIREHLGDEAILEVDYQDDHGSAMLRLNSSGDSILVTWSSDAALAAILLLQQQYRIPLRAIDLDFSFDLDLSSIPDLDTLKQAIEG